MIDIHPPKPPKVEANVKIVPAKRSASFAIVVGKAKLTANVNVKSITFLSGSDIPKTIEAADAIIALAQAVRDELVAEGIA